MIGPSDAVFMEHGGQCKTGKAKTHIGEEGAADRHRTRLAFGRKTGFDDRIVTHDWTADEHSYKLMKKSDR